ncbi:MAG: hypothetical protein WAU81_15110, partial [Candidatus Aminicenantales bacterium]
MKIRKIHILKIGASMLVIFLFCLAVACRAKSGASAPGPQGAARLGTQINPFDIGQEPEIEFVDGVPIFPWARPVVILKGSDFEMGYQYARQLAQIFGTWILELVNCDLSDRQLRALKGYEWHIKKQAPEMIGFFKGMMEGAKKVGVALTYEQVLAQFCLGVQNGEYVDTPADQSGYPKEITNQPPSSPGENPPKCGSVAAWGAATKDGKVIT